MSSSNITEDEESSSENSSILTGKFWGSRSSSSSSSSDGKEEQCDDLKSNYAMSMDALDHDNAVDRKTGKVELDGFDLQQYTDEIGQHVPDNSVVTVSESNRRTMFRTLMGWSKAEYRKEVQNVKRKMQYNATTNFLNQELIPWLKQAEEETMCVLIQECLQDKQSLHKTRKPPHVALLTRIAKGATYKGNFQSLLEDLAPHMIQAYLKAIANPGEITVLEQVIKEHERENAQSHHLKRCIHMSLPPTLQQEGGSKGTKCEEDCLQHILKRFQGQGDQILVVQSVLVKKRQRGRFAESNEDLGNFWDLNVSNEPRVATGILETSLEMKPNQSQEFDVLVLRKEPNEKRLSLLEAWEAKASLNPITIHDGLSKKLSTLKLLLSSELLSLHLDNGGSYRLRARANFAFVLYSTEVIGATRAVKQLASIVASQILAHDKAIVKQALSNDGKLVVSADALLQKIDSVQLLLHSHNPIVAVVEST